MGYNNPDNIFYGNDDDVKIGGATIGYHENAEINFSVEKEEDKNGNPLRLTKTFLKAVKATFAADLKETHPANILLAKGLQNNIVAYTEGSAVTTLWKTFTTRADDTVYASTGVYVEPAILNGYLYEITAVGSSPHKSGVAPPTYPTTIGATVADGDLTLTCRAYPGESVSLAAFRGGDINFCQLTGYNIKADADIIVYASDKLTKYTKTDDYFLDKFYGRVGIQPGGQIETDDPDTLWIVYKYTEITHVTLNNDPDTALLDSDDVEFTYTNKDTNDQFIIEFSKFQSDGNASVDLNTKSVLKMSGEAQLDSSNNKYELGKISFYAAA